MNGVTFDLILKRWIKLSDMHLYGTFIVDEKLLSLRSEIYTNEHVKESGILIIKYFPF